MIIENWLSSLRRGGIRGLLRNGDARRSGWCGAGGRAASVRHQANGRAAVESDLLETRTMLAGIVVTTAVDEIGGGLDTNHGTGVSLREAIVAANATVEADTITFDASLDGTNILLTLSGGGDTLGDLDITSEIAIVGNGAVNTVIDAGGASGLGDRVLDVLSGGLLTLEGVTVTGGRVGNVLGGGIRIQAGGTAEISDTAIADNRADAGGGGIGNEGVLTLVGSAVAGNQASSGGGLVTNGSTVTNVFNSTFSGNSANEGGGIAHFGGTVTITNSTITENTTVASSGGGGGGVSRLSGTGVTLNNTIVAGNTLDGSPNDLGGSGFNGSNNLIGDGNLRGLDSNTNLTGDPMLGPLQDNGGPTLTHALLAGSPAIDAGSDALAVDGDMNPLTTDQRGAGRFVGTVDIGAVEAIPETIVVTTATDENDGGLDPTNGTGVSLREAILAANFNPSDANTITFDASLDGTDIALTLGGGGDTVGDLDITSEITIIGNGAVNTVIDAGGDSGLGDRVLDVQSGGMLTLEGVTVTGGRVGNDGGGIRVQAGGTAEISDTAIADNKADAGGGGIGNEGVLTLIGSAVTGNQAGIDGGGLFTGGSSVTNVVNSTFSGNSSNFFGGGIARLGGTVTITNSTIADNASPAFGGGVSGTGVTLNNTIVAGNTVLGSPDDLSGTFNGSNNLIGDGNLRGLDSNTNLTGDPMLGALQDNGGPTLTHALLAGSPAIDAGSDALAVDGDMNPLATDQRGAGRFVGTVDIGAVEAIPETIVVTTATDENDGGLDPTNGTGVSLREAILAANFNPSDANTITFDASLDGTDILLTLSGGGDTLGDLDISSEITIVGNAAFNTVIDAGGDGGLGDRVLDVLSGGMLTLEGVTVTGGRVGNVLGGGIRIQAGGTAEISGSAIADNEADASGGGISNGGVLTLIGSAVTGNQAIDGGGLFTFGSSVTNVINSTLSGNSADSFGGGIARDRGTITITNSTITGNTSSASGSGVLAVGVTLNNTIVAGNFDGHTPADLSGTFNGSNNLIGDGNLRGLDSNTNLTGDPMLGPLQDNGGPTPTHAIDATSLAFDAGDNALAVDAAMAALANDQRGIGFDRVSNGTVDIGAFEVQVIPNEAPTVVLGTVTHTTAFTLDGASGRGFFGESVSVAGDVNGDGFADLIVGAFQDGPGGRARVFSGFDGSSLFVFNGDGQFGISVSGAGDVNGDGFDDLIVGANRADNNGIDSGSARVFSGADGSTLFTFDGDSVDDRFGVSVSGAGDVNGDGFDDLIVGANSDDNNGNYSGSARVFSGADGSTLFTFDGDNTGDFFGTSVSGAGDVNGDGFDDLVVGAYGDDSNGAYSGSARVFSGADGSTLFTFNGDNGGDHFGVSVSGAGDVNGDGFDDLIVGAYRDDNNGTSSGSARVFSGADGSTLFTFDGDNTGVQLGISVSGAGDVNGDGFDDLIVGADRDDNNGAASGSARVFSGADGSTLFTFDGDNTGDFFGTSVSGAGDINNDGFADLFVGIPQALSSTRGQARAFSSSLTSDPAGQYTEDDAPTPVVTNIAIADDDDTMLTQAVVQITGNYLDSEDVLAVSGMLPMGITAGAFDAVNGSITLSGIATIADYIAALKLVTYENQTASSTLDRTVTVSVTDANAVMDPAGVMTGSDTRDIQVTANNDAPVVNDQTFSVVENSANATIIGTVAATDEEGDGLSFAITDGNGTGGGAFAIDSDGVITVADSSQLDFETTPTFTLTVEVTDDGSPQERATGTITIGLSNVNDNAPIISDLPAAVNQTLGSVPLTIAPIATVADADSPHFNTGLARFLIEGANRKVGDHLQLASTARVTAGNTVGAAVLVDGFRIGTVIEVVGIGTRIDIRFNGQATPDRISALIQAVEFDTDEGGGVRTVQYEVRDGAGLRAFETVEVTITSQPPTLVNFPTVVSESIENAPVFIAPQASVTDADSADFNTALFRFYLLSTNRLTTDHVQIGTTTRVTAGNEIGSAVLVDGVRIGTVIAKTGIGTRIDVRLNGQATPDRVSALLQAVQFDTTEAGGERVARFVIEDGDLERVIDDVAITVSEAGSTDRASGISIRRDDGFTNAADTRSLAGVRTDDIDRLLDEQISALDAFMAAGRPEEF